jgi:hypothetical protein
MSDLMATKTARRGFLGRIAAAAAVVGLGGVPSRAGAENSPRAISTDAALEARFGKIQ